MQVGNQSGMHALSYTPVQSTIKGQFSDKCIQGQPLCPWTFSRQRQGHSGKPCEEGCPLCCTKLWKPFSSGRLLAYRSSDLVQEYLAILPAHFKMLSYKVEIQYRKNMKVFAEYVHVPTVCELLTCDPLSGCLTAVSYSLPVVMSMKPFWATNISLCLIWGQIS